MFLHYFQDGACWQSQAIACYLNSQGGVECTWDGERSRYESVPTISRWENCREQGYVISFRARNGKQLNIAFFDHRNSDSICMVEWQQNTINSPTIDTAKFGDIYKDKWDVSKTFSPRDIADAGDWIVSRLEEFWENNLNAAKDTTERHAEI